MSLLNVESRCEIIEVPIYEACVAVCCGSEKKIRKFFLKEFEMDLVEPILEDGLDGSVVTLRQENTGVPIWVIVLPTSVSLNTISHEVFHVTQHIMEHCMIDLSPDTKEPYAYLHGWLFQRVSDLLGI